MPERRTKKPELIDFICAAENNPGDFKTRMELVGAYQNHGQADRAMKELEGMAEEFPREPRLLIARGNLCLRNRKWGEAVNAYEAAVKGNVQTHEVCHNLGIACRGAGQNENAAKAFSAAIMLKPDSLESHLCLASVLLETGKSEESVGILEGLRPQHCANVHLLQLLAAACGKKNDYFKAMIYIEEALKQAPEDRNLLALKAEVLLQANRLEEAAAEYERLIEKFGEAPLFLCNRGLVRETMGDRQAALRDYDRSLEIDPDNIIARTNRGMLLAGTGATGRAINDFEEALKAQPENTLLLHNLGVAFIKRGDFDKAKISLKKACRLKNKPSCDLLRKMSQQEK